MCVNTYIYNVHSRIAIRVSTLVCLYIYHEYARADQSRQITSTRKHRERERDRKSYVVGASSSSPRGRCRFLSIILGLPLCVCVCVCACARVSSSLHPLTQLSAVPFSLCACVCVNIRDAPAHARVSIYQCINWCVQRESSCVCTYFPGEDDAAVAAVKQRVAGQ